MRPETKGRTGEAKPRIGLSYSFFYVSMRFIFYFSKTIIITPNGLYLLFNFLVPLYLFATRKTSLTQLSKENAFFLVQFLQFYF